MCRGEDERFMRLALELAEKGKGLTSPNPCVGTVIVKDGKVIGKGYHRKAGMPHAEIYALRQAGKNARGATLYVTLEPCRHYGRTPPCADAIISSGIKRIVAAMKDPNPLNNGRGFDVLRKNGIKVESGVLEAEARRLNEAFIKFITTKLPFVTVKIAQSIDGKIATYTGDSKWITSKEARVFSHRLRSEADAIMVGVKTIIKDDPFLSVRDEVKSGRLRKQPVKIILDSKLHTPTTARIFSKGSSGKVIIATTKRASKNKMEALKRKGAEISIVKSKDGKVDIKSLLKVLGEKELTHILIEGGGETIASALEAKAVDKVYFFIAPKIIGGRQAPTSVEGLGADRINRVIKLRDVKYEEVGEDFLVEGYIRS